MRLAFVDLETTGGSPIEDRITEVGIIEVDFDEADASPPRPVREWSALVNPDAPIPPFIETLTGITNAMVAAAPRFEELADDILTRLDGRLFVAHNARFDHGFLKNAFRRLDRPFRPPVLCTVRLSRKLYPGYSRHNLDTLIERHRLVVDMRHRALGDARLLWQLWQKLHDALPAAQISAAIDQLTARPSLPRHLDPDVLDTLPKSAGVYLFLGAPIDETAAEGMNPVDAGGRTAKVARAGDDIGAAVAARFDGIAAVGADAGEGRGVNAGRRDDHAVDGGGRVGDVGRTGGIGSVGSIGSVGDIDDVGGIGSVGVDGVSSAGGFGSFDSVGSFDGADGFDGAGGVDGVARVDRGGDDGTVVKDGRVDETQDASRIAAAGDLDTDGLARVTDRVNDPDVPDADDVGFGARRPASSRSPHGTPAIDDPDPARVVRTLGDGHATPDPRPMVDTGRRPSFPARATDADAARDPDASAVARSDDTAPTDRAPVANPAWASEVARDPMAREPLDTQADDGATGADRRPSDHGSAHAPRHVGEPRPLYIGKAKNLRQRVMAHFTGDHLSAREMEISQQMTRIEWIETGGGTQHDLGALLLEATLVKQRLPAYNRQLRRSEDVCAWRLVVARGHVRASRPRWTLALARPDDLFFAQDPDLYGPFATPRQAGIALRAIVDAHGLCPALLRLEKAHAGKPCFSHQVKRCRGACVGLETVAEHTMRLKAALASMAIVPWPFDGPIAFREGTTWHVVDGWAYLGMAADQDAARRLAVATRPFDHDIYRLLVRRIDAMEIARL